MDSEEKPSAGIPVKDAIRLLHETNKSITYGSSNLNASEMEELKKVDYPKVKADYFKWVKDVGVNPSGPALGFYGTIGLCGVFGDRWLAELLLIPPLVSKIVGSLCLLKLAGRLAGPSSHHEGYLYGYESGFSEEINKAFGLTEEDLKDIDERDIEIKMNERLVSKWDAEEKE